MKETEIMKKTVIILIIIASMMISSCKYYSEDPFLTDTDTQTGADTGVNTIIETETEAKKAGPDEDFYSLTEEEAIEKYGIVSVAGNFMNEENFYDDKYYYYNDFKRMNIDGKDIFIMPLCYRDRNSSEDTEGYVVCKDPLCFHTEKTNCPLAGLAPFSYIIKDGKCFFVKGNTELIMYDFKTNKSSVIFTEENLNYISLRNYDGSMTVQYSEFIENDEDEDEEFIIKHVFCKLSSDGKLKELGRIDESELGNRQKSDCLLYNDRYVVYTNSEINKDEKKFTLNLYDLLTGEITTVFEKDYNKDVGFNEFFENSVDGYTRITGGWALLRIYDDKIFIRVDLTVGKKSDRPDMPIAEAAYEYYLIDLKTKEAEKIEKDTKGSNLSIFHSNKYVFYIIPRKSEDDPFIVHIRDMINGTDKVYDLKEIVKEPISEKVKIFKIKKGAILFIYDSESVDNKVSYNTYELNMENGNVYKYDIPAV